MVTNSDSIQNINQRSGNVDGWRYYIHAAIPSTDPHIEANLAPLKDGSLWKNLEGRVLMARWTSDWDCSEQTNWWYVIKDSPFDIDSLKSKRRYEINKGKNNFDVRVINAPDYAEALYEVAAAAYETYPASYRPHIEHDKYVSAVRSKWSRYYKVYGAFSKADNTLCGFITLYKWGGYIGFAMMKAVPSQEKKGINAALVNGMLDDIKDLLAGGYYICDGERSLQHETAFQDYLEKYFGFRKAYCKLHIEYNPKYKVVMEVAYKIRGFLKWFDSIPLVRKVLLVFKMEEIARKDARVVNS